LCRVHILPAEGPCTDCLYSGPCGVLANDSSGWEKRVGDRHVSNLLSILKICTVNNVTLTLDREATIGESYQANRNVAPIRSASPYETGEEYTARSGRNVADKYCLRLPCSWVSQAAQRDIKNSCATGWLTIPPRASIPFVISFVACVAFSGNSRRRNSRRCLCRERTYHSFISSRLNRGCPVHASSVSSTRRTPACLRFVP
jgi:hypothetical protein